MAWMNESFKSDKRYLTLQLKRGKLKLRDLEALLSTLPDVSSKAEPLTTEPDNPPEAEQGVEDRAQEPEKEKGDE